MKWVEVALKARTKDGKNTTDNYIFEALSFAEAEARVVEELAKQYDEYEIVKINPLKVAEIITGNGGDIYYKCKVNYLSIGENGKEKKVPYYYYVLARTTGEAGALLQEALKDSVSDFVVESVAETKVIAVYPIDLAKEAAKLEAAGGQPGEAQDAGLFG